MEVLCRSRPCKKCFGQANIKWAKSITIDGVTFEDVIIRECAVCGFKWLELPLDATSNP